LIGIFFSVPYMRKPRFVNLRQAMQPAREISIFRTELY
jgi:hypothetical protein